MTTRAAVRKFTHTSEAFYRNPLRVGERVEGIYATNRGMKGTVVHVSGKKPTDHTKVVWDGGREAVYDNRHSVVLYKIIEEKK